MSRVPFSLLLAVALAVPLFAGCTGPLKLRDVHEERAARRAADGKEGLGRASLSDESPASSRDKEAFSTKLLGEALPPVPGLDAQTDTRVRDALWKLQRENPQGCKALKRILYEQDPSIPPLMAQGLREQCVAHLLADSKSPASPAGSMAACKTAIVPGTTGPGATGSGAAAVAASAGAGGSEANAATPASAAKAQPESGAGAGSAQSPSAIALASASEPIAAKSDAPPANTAAATPETAPASPPATTPAAAATGDSAAAKTGASDGQTTAVKETPSQHDPAADLKAGQWESEVQQAIETLEQELGRFKHDEVETARLNAMLRLLYVIANRREQAVKPIEGMTEDEREFWKQQLYGLAVSLDAEGRHALSRRASLALRYYDTAEDHLSNLSSLDVHGLAFCTRVESFGRYEEFKSADFKAGQEVLLYVEVSHFAAEARGDQFETELQGEYEVFDKQGVRVANVALPLDKQLCNNRRRDYFVAYRLFIPKDVPAGSYTLRLTVEDVKGRKSSQSSIDFKIRG